MAWVACPVSKGRREQRARGEAILETAGDAIVGTDRGGIIMLFNRAAEEMFGYAASEVLGQNVRILMPSPYRDEHDDYVVDYQRTRVPKAIGRIRSVEAQRKNGEVFPIELSVSEAHIGDEVRYTAIVRDVTERRKIDEALRRDRDFAERLIETADAIILVRDPDGRIVTYNRYFENLSGYRLAETAGKNWFATFLPPAYRQRAREIFVQVLCDGEAKGYVNSVITRDGSARDVEWHTKILRGDTGRPSGVLSIGHDITERRRAERYLAMQYALTRVLAEADSFAEATPKLLQALCEAAGWDIGELWTLDADRQTLRLEGLWHEPSLDAGKYAAAAQTMTFGAGEGIPGRVWSTGRPIVVTDLTESEGFVHRRLLDELEIHAALAFPIRPAGEVSGVISFFGRSVRGPDEELLRVLETLGHRIGAFIERKMCEDAVRYSEARFEAFMNNSPAIAYMKDEAGRMVYVNKPFERALATSLERIYGLNDFELWPAPIAEQLRASDREVLAANEPREVVEKMPAADGGMREWLVFKFPISDAAGQRFLAAVAVDVTDRRRAEAELRELQKLAQERERLADIGAITAKIAHDLGNPLSALSMQAQLVVQRARRDPSQPLSSVAKPIEQLVSEVRRLEGIIREFLSFAREQRLDLATIELRPFLRQVVDLWRPVATARQVTIRLDESHSPPEVRADEGKLRRVLDNLVKNAIEAIDPGPGEVAVVATSSGADSVRISVEDDGCGVPENVQLFRLFETTKPQGSGLGLAVSKQIVLAHGGDLVFAPRIPRGTVFHVDLPLLRLSP